MADTIVALASGRPPAAIAVVRISGPAAAATLERLAGPPPPVRRMVLRTLRNAAGEVLDRAMVVWFAAPASSTGETVAELHLHGGNAVVAAVLAALTDCPGVRLAAPGEFTRRAFDNNRLDLAEVEGLADLIAAQTDSQRRLALAQSAGLLSLAAEQWRGRCLDLLASIEAALDFAEDEADVAERLEQDAAAAVCALASELESAIADARRASRIMDGLTIVVSGPPNVGKSSLVNALARQDVVIVADRPGTTRDTVTVPLELDGVAAVLIDTAGLRETDDPVEVEGIRRARDRMRHADLLLDVSDQEAQQHPADMPCSIWYVRNKIDNPEHCGGQIPMFRISARHGYGLAILRSALCKWATGLVRLEEPPLLVNARQIAATSEAAALLREGLAEPDLVARAEFVRRAAAGLAEIGGSSSTEAVLDRIFSRFCIGK